MWVPDELGAAACVEGEQKELVLFCGDFVGADGDGGEFISALKASRIAKLAMRQLFFVVFFFSSLSTSFR